MIARENQVDDLAEVAVIDHPVHRGSEVVHPAELGVQGVRGWPGAVTLLIDVGQIDKQSRGARLER